MDKYYNVTCTVEIVVKAESLEQARQRAKEQIEDLVTEHGRYWADVRSSTVIAERDD